MSPPALDPDAVARLTDKDLLDRARALSARSSALTAELIVHLGEVDARRLYAGEGYSSTHTWCTGALGMSDEVAFNRIRVARAGRRFPALVERVGRGDLHLSGARVIAPHLTEANQDALLGEVSGKRKGPRKNKFVAPRAPRRRAGKA